MRNNPIVSVVLPFLNAEKFIQEAIESVLNQTVDNWELVLVDDGSTDKSTQIALKYAKIYPHKIHYLEHDGHRNKGANASRNLGIRHAHGKFVAFLDADDVFLPDKLEKQIKILDSNPEASCIYGATEFWYTWNGESNGHVSDHVVYPFVFGPDTLVKPPVLLYHFLKYKSHPCICSLMVRREVFERLGGFEESFPNISTQAHIWNNDGIFYIKLCLNEPVYIYNGCWDRYRQHKDSESHVIQRTGQSNAANLNFLKWVESYLIEQKCKNKKIWAALREQMWPYGYYRNFKYQIDEVNFYVSRLLMRLKRIILLKSSGVIRADPNPILVTDGESCIIKVEWSSKKTEKVEVHIGSPGGPLFSRTGSSGCSFTGNWVKNGMIFYLQDISSGKALTFFNTLDKIKIKVKIKLSLPQN